MQKKLSQFKMTGLDLHTEARQAKLSKHESKRISIARWLLIALLGSLGCAGAAIGVSMKAEQPPLITNASETLEIRSLEDQLSVIEDAEVPLYRQEQVRRGDTLSGLLLRMGVRDPYAENFIRNDATARKLFHFDEGQWISVITNPQRQLLSLRLSESQGPVNSADKFEVQAATAQQVVISRLSDNHFFAHIEAVSLEQRIEVKSVELRGKYFASTDAAGVPDSVSSQIADIFSGQLDMEKDIKRGDRINLVYESFFDNGEFARAGRVLAVELYNRGKRLSAVWFDEPALATAPAALKTTLSTAVKDVPRGGYYSYEGRRMAEAFIRNPLEFTRISSEFTEERLHPIFQNWKAHTGVDFAAPTGTKVKSAGDGVVDFVGQQRGYGNVVFVKHANNITTVYAHLSAFSDNMNKGDRVAQNQVIGFVGQTGWATGPHLHYEFRVNDVPVDPMTAVLPPPPELSASKRSAFKMMAADVQHRIELSRSVRLARAE
ncbi:M23 family metallopeptidase [Ampullimonas aquatilis]|uniref:M23 family metallopeptidase n=1 Tax=Ampullimonas aquatilis TaxID=1341549 RepID=UPI003C749BAB